MTDESKEKLKYWLIGLFTGAGTAIPITAFVCKGIYDKKVEEAVDQAETNGINAGVEYALQKQAEKKEESKEEEDIQNYDLSYEGEELEEEARERTEAHERYLDMIDKYSGDSVNQPRIIDADKFITEQYMEKAYVNWYEEDDVFEEDLNVIEDPNYTFGVTSGRELFKNADERPDPDICYVRNERTTTDFEISRIHGSYAKMVGGESGLGETDT